MNLVWRTESLQPGASDRPRLAIVSTYDELCGIAGYTRALERQLQPLFEVSVLELDQYYLRSPHAAVQKLADRHIRELAQRLRAFDFVNIQLEYGTLGRTPQQILRRFRLLARAAPALSVTFHTVLPADRLDLAEVMGQAGRLKLAAAGQSIGSWYRRTLLTRGLLGVLRRLQRVKPVCIITHTRRDARLLADVYRLREVRHHPLAFVTPAMRAEIEAAPTRDRFPLLATLPPGTKLIGSFGFLSEYKGFETVIRALRHLPEDHHLLIFGGVHPQTIKPRAPIDPYLLKLLDETNIDRTVFDDLAARAADGMQVSVAIDAASRDLLSAHPQSLLGRVHFMGALSDSDFLAAMTLCDCVVLAYLEVGQSASGPISMALEMGRRVIASRTNTFLQYAKYHPGQIEFFDIGNHVELAGRLRAAAPADCAQRVLDYNAATNAALYLEANSRWDGRSPPARPAAAPARAAMASGS